MFTGLIQAVGSVASISPTATGVRIVIDPRGWAYTPALGDSIAVSGACLTVAAFQSLGGGPGNHHWCFDAIPETLAKTTLGSLRPGSPVNLEHALTPSTLLGGHFVQGHVDGVGTVESIDTAHGQWRVTVRPPASVMRYMVPKGSVCLAGVSLTIADLTADTLTVALIPVTLEKTTLGTLQPGDQINIEADVLVKAVVATVERVTASRQ